MWKRILLVTAFVGLVGVLLGGAVFRTLDRTGLVVEAQGRGFGRDQHGIDETSDIGPGGGGRAEGRGYGRGESSGCESCASRGDIAESPEHGSGRGLGTGSDGNRAGKAEGRGNGAGGQGQGNGRGGQTGTDQDHTEEWVTLEGVVAAVEEDTLLVQTDDGAQVVVEGRAWRFAQEEAFWAEPGDEVTLTGFHEGEEFKVGQIEDTTSGLGVLLRDGDGRPTWAGRGRLGN